MGGFNIKLVFCVCVCMCMSVHVCMYCVHEMVCVRPVIPTQGILDVYRHALGQADLYGPTNFASFLDKAINYATGAVTQDNQNYYILMVITVRGSEHALDAF